VSIGALLLDPPACLEAAKERLDAAQPAHDRRRSCVHLDAEPRLRTDQRDRAGRDLPVFDMLLAVPNVGSVKATKILNSCRVSPSKTFGGLSERQRAELAGRLDRS
jgi:hypothetical protein